MIKRQHLIVFPYTLLYLWWLLNQSVLIRSPNLTCHLYDTICQTKFRKQLLGEGLQSHHLWKFTK